MYLACRHIKPNGLRWRVAHPFFIFILPLSGVPHPSRSFIARRVGEHEPQPSFSA